MMARGDARDGK